MSNEVISKRNAVKETHFQNFDRGRGLVAAEATVVTISDADEAQQQVVETHHYTSEFASMDTDHVVLKDQICVRHHFFQHPPRSGDLVVQTSTFEDDPKTFNLKLKSHDEVLPAGELVLFLNKTTARKIEEAILAQFNADEEELESAN